MTKTQLRFIALVLLSISIILFFNIISQLPIAATELQAIYSNGIDKGLSETEVIITMAIGVSIGCCLTVASGYSAVKIVVRILNGIEVRDE